MHLIVPYAATATLLEGVEAKPFQLRLAGCGVFGGNKPHSLFAAVEESPELRRLQSIHERICQALGLPAEQRKFAPHVTLARLRHTEGRALYVTLSAYLAQSARALYAAHGFENPRHEVDFLSYRSMFPWDHLGGGLELALACHHRVALDVPPDWFRGMIDTLIDVIEASVPAIDAAEQQAWTEMREALVGLVERNRFV